MQTPRSDLPFPTVAAIQRQSMFKNLYVIAGFLAAMRFMASASAFEVGDRIVMKAEVDVVAGGKTIDRLSAGTIVPVMESRNGGQELLVSDGVQGWIPADQALPLTQAAFDYFQNEIKTRPGDAKMFHARARLLRAMNQLDAARDSCNLAIGYDPEYAVAYRTRGDVNQDQGKLAEAIADYDVAIAKDPNSAMTFNNRGFAKQQLGDKQGALDDYTAAIKANPLFCNGHHNRAILRQEAGQYAEALADYTEAIKLNPNHVAALHNRGQVQLELGNPREAVADFSEALRMSPEDPVSLEMRARAWIASQDFQRAIRDLDEAIRFSKEPSVDLLMQRGELRSAMGNQEAALEDLDRALAIDPQSAASTLFRAKALHRLRRIDEANAAYDRADQLADEKGHASVHEAEVWREQGEPDRAIEELTKAIASNATLSAAFMCRGQLRSEKGDFAWAVDDFNRAIRLNDKDSIAYHNRGLANYGLKKYDAAYRDFSRALEMNPNLKESYKNRSDLLIESGNFPLAEADASQAIRIDPAYADAYRSRADSRLMLGRHEEARQDYEQTLRLIPEHATALSGLAKIAAAKGDMKGAREQLSRAIAAAPKELSLLFERAESSLMQGDLTAALADVEAVLALQSDQPMAILRQVQCCLLLGRYAEAREAMTALMEVDAELRAPVMMDVFFYSCILHLGAGKTAEALSDAIGVAETAPQSSIGPFLEGMVRHMRKDFELASQAYSRVLQLEPAHERAANGYANAVLKLPADETPVPDLTTDFATEKDLPTARLKRARLRHFLGFPDLAKEDYAEAIRLAPGESGYLIGRAELFHSIGDYDAAIGDLSLVIKADPRNANAIMERGAILAKQQKHKEALLDYQRAKELASDRSILFMAMYHSYDALGDSTAAGQTLDAGIERFPADATLLNMRATFRAVSGNLTGGLSDSAAALALAPDDTGIRFMHGMLLLRNGKLAEAEAEFTRITEKSPRYAAAYMYRGHARLQRNQDSLALKDFDEVIALLGSNSFAHLGRGDVHYRNGDDELALAEYLKALQTETESAPLLTRLALIYAESPERSLRNLEEATALAEQAVKVTAEQDPAALTARAATRAGVGQFPQAIEDLKQASALLKDDDAAMKASSSQRLQSYESKTPWEQSRQDREKSPPPAVLDEFLRIRWASPKS